MSDTTTAAPAATTPATAAPLTGTLNFDGVDYPMASLSDEARQQLANVRAADQELQHLRQQAAFVQTARLTYLHALKAALTKA
jgi:hypothetical protein